MKNFILFLSLLSLSGCATIFSGTTQTMNVKVVDTATNDTLPGASCVAKEANGGTTALDMNSGSLTVTRGQGALNINCTKQGYRQLNTMVGESFNGVSLINILFWPGFLVDVGTGAIKKYPSHYVVNMEKISAEKVSK